MPTLPLAPAVPAAPPRPSTLWQRLRRRRGSRWAVRLIGALVVVAALADFIANDKPLVASYQGQTYYPVLRTYASQLGWGPAAGPGGLQGWRQLEYDWVVWPPIPYAAHTLDLSNANFTSPFADQKVAGWRHWHWLGTDRVGRDVAAGLVAGARTAILVGIVSMGIAAFIGIWLGALAGFFGDTDLRLRRAPWWGGLLGLAVGLFWGLIGRGFALGNGPLGWEVLVSVLVVVATTAVGAGLGKLALGRLAWGRRLVTIPVDLLVMRLIELINAIPKLLLLLAVVAVVQQPSILLVMAVIGLLSWTGIARFLRAELLRIRRLAYIDAARTQGLSEGRILWRHALPNALGPVLTALAFGVAGAILLEAFLSFLGIGLPPDVVTWGSQLQAVRNNVGAWWLAIFPGLAIFVTVTLFNVLGQRITEALTEE